MTVGGWLGLWINSTRAEVSPKTHERYAEIVRCYLVPALGGIRLQRLTPSDIQRGYNAFTRQPSSVWSLAARILRSSPTCARNTASIRETPVSLPRKVR